MENDVLERSVPAVEKVIPPDAVPVIDRPRSNIPHVTPRFPRRLQPPLVLPEPVRLAERGDGPAAGVRMEGLERIDLLEEVEVALVAAFECLVRFLAAEHVHGALQNGGGGQQAHSGV